MPDDLELLEQWRGGNVQAGQALFSRHFDELHRFLHNKSADGAEDLVQRTFLACVASRDRFRGDSSFRTYLFSIARNELYAHLRRCHRDGERLDFGVSSIAELVTTPATAMARDQSIQALRQAMRALPVDQQLLLELRYWHGLNATELGVVLDVPAATVRGRLLQARRVLRAGMSEQETTLRRLLSMGQGTGASPRP